MGYPRAVHYAASIALAAAIPSAARADDYTGNKILSDCDTNSGAWSAGACFGRIVAVLNTFDLITETSGKSPIICARPNVTNGQMVDIVVAWLKRHPEKRDLDYTVVTIAAAVDAFPCPKK